MPKKDNKRANLWLPEHDKLLIQLYTRTRKVLSSVEITFRLNRKFKIQRSALSVTQRLCVLRDTGKVEQRERVQGWTSDAAKASTPSGTESRGKRKKKKKSTALARAPRASVERVPVVTAEIVEEVPKSQTWHLVASSPDLEVRIQLEGPRTSPALLKKFGTQMLSNF